MIIAVPSNDFGGQEPGGASEIHATASHVYASRFRSPRGGREGREPTSLLQMGRQRAPARRAALELPQILIGRDGHIVAAFPSAVEPNDPRLIAAIEKQLAE